MSVCVVFCSPWCYQSIELWLVLFLYEWFCLWQMLLWHNLSCLSWQMILFSACCICGLIGGILNFQFLRALTKKSSALYSLHLASMSLACIGIGGCTLSSWLTCRLASYEQRRMFSEREHSLHHSHEMAEKVSCVSSFICSASPKMLLYVLTFTIGKRCIQFSVLYEKELLGNETLPFCVSFIMLHYMELFLGTVYLQYIHFNEVHPFST